MLLDPRRGHVDVEATDAKGRTALFYCINLHDLRPLPSEHHKTMRTVTGLLKQRQRGRPESRDHVRAARRREERRQFSAEEACRAGVYWTPRGDDEALRIAR